MKTILFTTDLTSSGNHALNWAQMLTNQYRATLHLVHVHTPNAAVPVVPGVGAAIALNTVPLHDDGLAREQLAKLAQQVAQQEIAVQTHYRAGNIEDEVSAVAQEIQADLIVAGRQAMDSFFDRLLAMTTRERGFLDTLLSPSLTGRMLEHSAIPVLVYEG